VQDNGAANWLKKERSMELIELLTLRVELPLARRADRRLAVRPTQKTAHEMSRQNVRLAMRDGTAVLIADQSRNEALLLEFEAVIPTQLTGLSRHEFMDPPAFCKIALDVDGRGGFTQTTKLLPWTELGRPPVRILVQIPPEQATQLDISVSVPPVLMDWVFVVGNAPEGQIEVFDDAGFLTFEEIKLTQIAGVAAIHKARAFRTTDVVGTEGHLYASPKLRLPSGEVLVLPRPNNGPASKWEDMEPNRFFRTAFFMI
jgi:hypothetical protein